MPERQNFRMRSKDSRVMKNRRRLEMSHGCFPSVATTNSAEAVLLESRITSGTPKQPTSRSHLATQPVMLQRMKTPASKPR